MFSSWRTTLGGIASLLTALGALAHALSTGNWDVPHLLLMFQGVINAYSHINARDNVVTDKQANAG